MAAVPFSHIGPAEAGVARRDAREADQQNVLTDRNGVVAGHANGDPEAPGQHSEQQRSRWSSVLGSLGIGLLGSGGRGGGSRQPDSQVQPERASDQHAAGERSTQPQSALHPTTAMKNLLEKISESTRLYKPQEIEPPEQLVMNQEGQYYVIDLGYTRIAIRADEESQTGSVKLRQRCTMMMCPWCLNGPKAAFAVCVEKRVFQTFVFLTCIVDIVMFAVVVGTYGVEDLETNPLIGPSACALYKTGAKWTPDIVVRGQVWRLVSPIFLHGGVIHICVNVFTQLSIGFLCEYGWGTPGVAVTYMASGVVGNVMSALGSPETLSVGASGAILGLVGGQIAHTWVMWTKTDPRLRAARMRGLAATLLLLVASGFLGPVDNWAHFGGLAAGAVVGLVIFRSEMVYSGWRRHLAQVLGLFGAATIALLTAVLFTLQRDDVEIESKC